MKYITVRKLLPAAAAALLAIMVPVLLTAAGIRTPLVDEAHAGIGDPGTITVQLKANSMDNYDPVPTVTVSWTGSGSGYDIYRNGTLAGSSYSKTFQDTYAFAAGTTYTYKVKYKGNDIDEGTAAFTPSAAMLSPDAMPDPEAVVASDNRSATISWAKKNDLKAVVYSSYYNGHSHVNTKLTETPLEPSVTSYKVSGLEYNTEYTYLVGYVNKYGTGNLMDVTFTTGSEPSPGGSGEGGSGGSGGSGSETNVEKARITDLHVVEKAVGGVYISASADYRTSYIKLFKDGKFLVKLKTTYFYKRYVPVRYAGKTKIKAVPYDASGRAGTGRTIRVKSKKMAAPKVFPVKLSSGKALVSWYSVAGATKYKVYKGNKLYKTVKKAKLQMPVTGKGAGSAKYKIVAVRASEGRKYTKAGKVKKPLANTVSWSVNKNAKAYSYGTYRFAVSKVTQKGNTYYVTGYAINNRIFKLKRYKKLTVEIKSNGKVVARKVFKNLKVNAGASSSKKLTLRIRGKAIKDIRNFGGYNTQAVPYWATVGSKTI